MLLYTIQTDKWNDRCFWSVQYQNKPKHFLYLRGSNNSNEMHGEPKKTREEIEMNEKRETFVITSGAESTIISNRCTENINSFWNPLKCLCFGWIRVIKPSNTFSCSHLNFGIPLTMIADTPQPQSSPTSDTPFRCALGIPIIFCCIWNSLNANWQSQSFFDCVSCYIN